MDVRIDGNMKERRFQKLPKRYVASKCLKLTDGYRINLTFWVPHIPYSRNKPKVGFTMSHGPRHQRQYFRLIFESNDYIKGFMAALCEFYLAIESEIEKAHKEELQEWQDLWDKIAQDHEAKAIAKYKGLSFPSTSKEQSDANNSELKGK